jgi:hypothetical protein
LLALCILPHVAEAGVCGGAVGIYFGGKSADVADIMEAAEEADQQHVDRLCRELAALPAIESVSILGRTMEFYVKEELPTAACGTPPGLLHMAVRLLLLPCYSHSGLHKVTCRLAKIHSLAPFGHRMVLADNGVF